MNPKLKFWTNTTAREIACETFNFKMAIQVLIVLKIYKWTSLGPDLFEQKFLAPKQTAYQVLQFLWQTEIWPSLVWIPVAIILDVLLKQCITRRENPKLTQTK